MVQILNTGDILSTPGWLYIYAVIGICMLCAVGITDFYVQVLIGLLSLLV